MLRIESELEKLERLYSFRGREEVLTFLKEHPELVPVLLKAPVEVNKHFPNAPVALEVIADADEPQWAELAFLVETDLEPNEVTDKMHQFYDWWLQFDYKTRQLILIGSE